MVDEFARIREIRKRLERASPDVVIGIGDDAAVLAPSTRAQILSVDAQVEGVHFRREWLSFAELGYRAVAAALSDLGAMGAEPRAILCGLCVPRALTDAELFAIVDGIAEAQREYGANVVGGNLAAASELSLTTTVVGECDGAPLTRRGARAGEALYVTGSLGGAALGLRLLQRAQPERAPESVARWRRPEARIREGRALQSLASSAIDVSDGLLQDLAHLAESSSVGFEVELERLPIARELQPIAHELSIDPWALALAGGEDYELLFTARERPPLGVRIGTVTEDRRVRVLDARGRELATGNLGKGFDHFAGP